MTQIVYFRMAMKSGYGLLPIKYIKPIWWYLSGDLHYQTKELEVSPYTCYIECCNSKILFITHVVHSNAYGSDCEVTRE